MNVMTAAAQKAARGLKRDFGEVALLQVTRKGPADFVSAADRKAEKTLFEELSRARPGYGFRMEESGVVEGKDKTHVWHIDPLDGTTNFLHGIPHFAISIGLERDGQLVAGLVYNPVTDEMYVAEKGQGAYLNSQRLRVAQRSDIREAVVCCGIPHIGRGDTGSSRTNWRRSWLSPPACAAPARRRSTSPTSRPAASTRSGSAASRPGTWRRARCSCAKPAAMWPT